MAVVAQPQVGLVANEPATHDLTALLAPVKTTACMLAACQHGAWKVGLAAWGVSQLLSLLLM